MGEDKVLVTVTDNGSNIVKAVRLLKDRSLEQRDDSPEGPQAQPGSPRDGQDEQWSESVSEETSEEDEGTENLSECVYSAIYICSDSIWI